jgi:hypothetical protein
LNAVLIVGGLIGILGDERRDSREHECADEQAE